MKVLGLDISSTNTGWAILDDGPTLLEYGTIPFSSFVPQKQRLIIFSELLKEMTQRLKPDFIAIEDTYVQFDPAVTKLLSRFAGVAILAISSVNVEIPIALISTQSVRSALFPKQKKNKEAIKIEMINRFSLIPNLSNMDELTASKALKKYCNDITDAIAVAHYPHLLKVNPKWIA
jgi:crossover junction endodeoxyribonuclease RuvC